MQVGKSPPVKGYAELDTLRTTNQIWNEAPVIDVGRSEEVVGKIEISRVPDFIDYATDQRGEAD